MGQKTHPLGYRLGITQEHQSVWCTNWTLYATLLTEDDAIRTYIKKFTHTKGSISAIKINRNGLGDQIEVTIETGRPGMLVGEDGLGIKTLKENLKNKILSSNRQLTINVKEVENLSTNAPLIAELVAQQIEDRVPFRRAVREALQCMQDDKVNGIKVQVSGRLNGAEIARREWARDGRVPLQTLRADIDYATNEANTIYGIIGVKVWVFKSEILKK